MNYNKAFLSSMFGLALLLIWVSLSVFGEYSPVVLPSPLQVLVALADLFKDTDALLSIARTLTRIIIATTVSIIVGIGTGIIAGHYRIFDDATETFIDFLRSTPSITLLPLFVIFFGINDLSRMMVCFTIAIPLIIVNTKYGVRNSRKTRQKLAKLYNIPKHKILTRITLPEASPHIYTGIRIAISIIIAMMIVAEMLLGQDYGIGQMIIDAQHTFDTAKMLAAIIIIGTIGFCANIGLNRMEKKIFYWR